ncbi:MAG: hypothetical protein DA408_10935 [Bacteroidetes bacterium]|nr:MAG: hypothetical protein C7N36_16640 [Bacteroidota bacterium]PTM12370.1 MAG: hypothetical protein DA408_10935 [Bacteroidota bacterium]
MKYNNRFYLFPLLCLFLVLTACEHDTDQFDGPGLVDRFGEFQLLEGLTISRATVDFSAGETVIFGARFNKRLNFTLRITGMESGSVKTIQGFDNELNANNAVWSGGTTMLPLFKREMCQVELIIPDENNLTLTGMVEIVGTKSYEGSLFTDFETPLGANLFTGNFEFELTNRTGRQNDMPAAQGDWYFLFEGTDNVVPNFFVGLADISARVTGETYIPFPTTVPEDLYFNAFIYADGGPHGIAVIQFVYDLNNTGLFEDGQDQTFQLAGDYPLDFTGWRQISHPMSDLGITQAQLSKMVGIRLLLISNMNSQPSPPLKVDYGIDFITFTAGGPLEL